VLVATQNDGVPAILAELAAAQAARAVGPVASLARASAELDTWNADVVVVELESIHGLDGVRAVAAAAPTVVVSSVSGPGTVAACMAAGVRAFVCKPLERGVLERAVAAVAAGHAFIDGRAHAALVDTTGDGSAATGDPQRQERSVSLPERQVEILQLVGLGRTNEKIAAELGISVNTVKTHLRRAIRALGARDRHEAARKAQDAQGGPPDDGGASGTRGSDRPTDVPR
jgi:DNA-binding NarL/FixJ family response regulator